MSSQYPKVVERREDMSPDGRLQLIVQADGDIIVHVIPGLETAWYASHAVEFCCVGAGGGRSPNVRKALMDLYKAIEKDNAENPLPDPNRVEAGSVSMEIANEITESLGHKGPVDPWTRLLGEAIERDRKGR